MDEDEAGPTLEEQFHELLALPDEARVDVCLFWDLFNYLDSSEISALLSAMRPYLHPGTRAHAFAVHKLNSPENSQRYGLLAEDEILMKPRTAVVPGYAPHAQSKLRDLLDCFVFDRSVLLAGSRLEVALKAKAL